MPVKKTGKITRAQLAKRTKKELLSLLKEFPAFGISPKGKGKVKKSDLVDAMVKSPKWDCLSKTLPPRTKRKQSTKQKANFEKMIKNRVNRQLESIVYPDTLSTPAKRKEARVKNLLKEKVLAYENPDYLKLKRVQSPDYFRLYPELVSVEAKQREGEALKGVIKQSTQETAELAHRVDVESLLQQQHRTDLEKLIQGLLEEKGGEEKAVELGDVETAISIDPEAERPTHLVHARTIAAAAKKFTRAKNRINRIEAKAGQTRKDAENLLKSRREIDEATQVLLGADRASLTYIAISAYLKRAGKDDVEHLYYQFFEEGTGPRGKSAKVDQLLNNADYFNEIVRVLDANLQEQNLFDDTSVRNHFIEYILHEPGQSFTATMDKVLFDIYNDTKFDEDFGTVLDLEHSSTIPPDIFGDIDIEEEEHESGGI